MWNKVGMARNEKGLKEAIVEIEELKHEFYKDVYVPGDATEFNPELEKAIRVADYLELGQLMAMDALQEKNLVEDTSVKNTRQKMVKHFVTMKTLLLLPRGNTKEEDIKQEVMHKEDLKFEFIELTQRSYK